MFTSCLTRLLLYLLNLGCSHGLTFLKFYWRIVSRLWIHSIVHRPIKQCIGIAILLCILLLCQLIWNLTWFWIYSIHRLTAIHWWVVLWLVLRCWYTFIGSLNILVWIDQCHVLNVHHVQFWSWCCWLCHLIRPSSIYTLSLEILPILCLVTLLMNWSRYRNYLSQLWWLRKSLLIHWSKSIESTTSRHLLGMLRLLFLLMYNSLTLTWACSGIWRANSHAIWMLLGLPQSWDLLLLRNCQIIKILPYALIELRLLLIVLLLLFGMTSGITR